ncbi:MAG TPA: DNA methyltransferase [Bryobacteraceae bacterium]|nr:DNA methyltransferase [Bryobacteraceae bacterium]
MLSQETAAQIPQIQFWPIERLVFYARNPRKNDAAVDRMCSSIREFGFKCPVLARSDGTVVDGHLRIKAARQLGSWPGGDTTAIPVILCDEWTPAHVKAFRLLVNRSGTWADWDLELLGPELADLKDLAYDVSLTGFDAREIDALLASPDGDEKANATPPLPEVAVTQPEDLWCCGPHRVLCSDATQESATSRLFARTVPFLMVTDQPYGVSVDPTWREEAGLNPRTVQGGKVANDDRVDWSQAWQLFPGDVAYVWHAGIYAGEVAASLFGSGFQIRAQIIWRKQHFVISRGAYHWQHEPCWYAVRKGSSAHWRGDRTQSTVWDVSNLGSFGGDRSEEKTGHGTQKPVELMRCPILNHTERGDAVYDPFLGSGTCMAAAELTGRLCYGMDIDPRYVDVAVLRWQALTGKEATLADGPYAGATFEHVKEGRLLAAEDAIKDDCERLLDERACEQVADQPVTHHAPNEGTGGA